MFLTYEVVRGFESAGVWEPASLPSWGIGLSWLTGMTIDLMRGQYRWRTKWLGRG